jgi:hypothetical protein
MTEYHKIPSARGFKHNRCFAFVKYDGSNVGFSWSKKQGFHKSRLRRGLFGADDPYLGWAVKCFQDRYSEPMGKLFTDHKLFRNVREVSVFGEAFGPSSLAGTHKLDEPHEVIAFDIWLHDFGFLGPKEFLEVTKKLEVPVAKCVFDGKFTGQLTEDVRNGKYAEKGVFEGVVIKAGKGGDDLEMAKVKTYAYRDRLREIYGEKWGQFWE